MAWCLLMEFALVGCVGHAGAGLRPVKPSIAITTNRNSQDDTTGFFPAIVLRGAGVSQQRGELCARLGRR